MLRLQVSINNVLLVKMGQRADDLSRIEGHALLNLAVVPTDLAQKITASNELELQVELF